MKSRMQIMAVLAVVLVALAVFVRAAGWAALHVL